MQPPRQDQLKLYGFQIADCLLNAHHGIVTSLRTTETFLMLASRTTITLPNGCLSR